MKSKLTLVFVISLIVLSCTVPVKNKETDSSRNYSGESFIIPDAEPGTVMVAPPIFNDIITESADVNYRKKKQDLLASYVYDELATRKMDFQLVPFFETMKAFKKLNNFKPGYNNLEISLNAARTLGADSLFVTKVSRYIERKGSEMGVEEPASVSLTFELYETGTAKILWLYQYGETQQPLLYDVSKIKKFVERGGKWVTADELALEAIEKAANRLQKAMDKR